MEFGTIGLWLERKEEEPACQIYPEKLLWRVLHFQAWYGGSIVGQSVAPGQLCFGILLCDEHRVLVKFFFFKKENPKISLLLALCRNISVLAPPNVETGSTRVHSDELCLFATTSPWTQCFIISTAHFILFFDSDVTATPDGSKPTVFKASNLLYKVHFSYKLVVHLCLKKISSLVNFFFFYNFITFLPP